MIYTIPKVAKQLARFVLEHAAQFEWSLQGLGMLRLYLSPNVRLHVWDRRFAFPSASPIHDHLQWDLHSVVIAGRLVNQRYRIVNGGRATHHCAKIQCGPGGCLNEMLDDVRLYAPKHEIYAEGYEYSQKADEIHESTADNGTVTVMQKFPTGVGEIARVFWPLGETWGSAEPRPATPAEVKAITEYSLERWFK